ncbi:FAD-linked oxidoreductase chyH [Cladobotryum mycophilum]|uniref:FAD-linked oxidoreductase chyH n=1 Tax=Cladobotryum mycophilum TaxID=491253 RepID=A0ABR0SBS9_9HYPO
MHHLLEAFTSIAAWATGNASIPSIAGLSEVRRLEEKVSNATQIYFPGSGQFADATSRWSVLETPQVNVVVVPGTVDDVAETVKFANKLGLPFLAFNGAHGSTTTLGKMRYGVEIYLSQLSSAEIANDGQTVKIGGGTNAKLVTDTLWAAGKQAVTGTCECVSYLGPALGGGHGWLQGHHGLIADQFVSVDIVTADGNIQTIDAQSDLWWALNGAGHNFGIVTSVTSKIYDIEHRDWAIETFIFAGHQVEAVYQATNEHLLKNGTQPAGLINWSYWLNIPDADLNNPIILFYIIQEGVKAIDSIFTKPFHDIGPLSVEPLAGDYNDLAAWTGIANASPPCQKAGLANPRFPIYLESYNVPAQKRAYDLYASAIRGSSAFNGSLFMFEGYPMGGVRTTHGKSSAFAFRDENILAAPLITYAHTGSEVKQKAATLGNQLRQILHKATGRKTLRAYVNYSYGDETTQELYGDGQNHQDRLRALKRKYDPHGRFSFYAPIE